MADRIFITGGSGRIGLPLVASLVAEGHDVVCLVRSDQGEQAVVECGAQAVRGTLEDTEALQRGAQGAERIFHLAGGVRGRGSETADVLNRIGTQNLLEVLQGRQDLRSLVLASSCAVYGDRSSLWVEEDFRTSPNTSYGASKVDAEDLCLAALKSSGLPVVIARIGAVYGPSFSFSMADRMQAGRAFLPGEGRNTVPVISITDCVRALTLLSEQGEPGGIYHVSDRGSPSLKEFYEEVHQMVGGRRSSSGAPGSPPTSRP